MATYNITFAADGYSNLDVTAAPSASTYTMAVNTTTVTVTSCLGGTPISGATIGVIPSGSSPYVTDANGSFTFENCDDMAACTGGTSIVLAANSGSLIPATGGSVSVFARSYYGLQYNYIFLYTTGGTNTSITSTRVYRPGGPSTAVNVSISANPYSTARTVYIQGYGQGYDNGAVWSNTLTFTQLASPNTCTVNYKCYMVNGAGCGISSNGWQEITLWSNTYYFGGMTQNTYETPINFNTTTVATTSWITNSYHPIGSPSGEDWLFEDLYDFASCQDCTIGAGMDYIVDCSVQYYTNSGFTGSPVCTYYFSMCRESYASSGGNTCDEEGWGSLPAGGTYYAKIIISDLCGLCSST